VEVGENQIVDEDGILKQIAYEDIEQEIKALIAKIYLMQNDYKIHHNGDIIDLSQSEII
jgi:hypothetical protein